MKLLKIILCTVTFAMLLCSNTVGQKAVTNSHVFVGGEYDNHNGFGSTFGVATRITGDLWSLAHGRIGEAAAALETDIAYFVRRQSWRLGLVAGPNIDWVGAESPITYILGSTGILGGYLSERTGFGVMGGLKYKFALEKDTYYRDGWQGGIWITYGLGSN
jgi:hypothetical protein